MSDSLKKLARLELPANLEGKAVLDIGCNEGFFCNVAAQRGARRVVGIDFFGPALAYAREHYTNPAIEFRQQAWATLPNELFDLILWTSSMHYERDPLGIMRAIADRLAPDGLFVLECGIAEGLAKEMTPSLRHSDSRWYPTLPFLTDILLERFSFRPVGGAELTPGDPLPRSVFHCKNHLPTVILFRGTTRHGKSSIAQRLAEVASKVISLDLLVHRIANSEFFHTEIQNFIRDVHDSTNLSTLYLGVDSRGLTQEYASLLAEAVAPSDQVVIIEGMMTDLQATALTNELKGKAVVWDSERRFPEN